MFDVGGCDGATSVIAYSDDRSGSIVFRGAVRGRKARQFNRQSDDARAAFFNEIAAILSDIVREKGALVVIDRRDGFLSADRIDSTDEAIARINETVSDDE